MRLYIDKIKRKKEKVLERCNINGFVGSIKTAMCAGDVEFKTLHLIRMVI